MSTSGACILLTNDDGLAAPGLLALAQAMRGLGTVRVIAPEHNWSASGHSKTMHKPLRASPARLADGTEATVTSGSPSDCVALALLGLLDCRPQLVVSGINSGANVGHDLTYSGTVAAAMEGVIGGVNSIAVSLDTLDPADCSVAARFTARLAERLLRANKWGQNAPPLLLNVNVPAAPEEEIAGVRATRLGRRVYHDTLIERRDPRGKSYYWIGGEVPQGLPEEGTDIGALAEKCISVTPVLLDLTDYARLAPLRDWLADLGMNRKTEPS